MTDVELIRKRLAFIETCLEELRRLARPERVEEDIRERRFIEHTLQLAIQAALDVASHIVADERLGEPRTNRELFGILNRSGWLDPALAAKLEEAAGFRNIVVHGYLDLDLAILRDVVEHRLDDLATFVASIEHGLRQRGADAP